MKEQKGLLAVKVGYDVVEQVKRFCRERGMKYGFFVEKAVLEQMAREELKEDLVDLKELRGLEDRSVALDDYVRNRRG